MKVKELIEELSKLNGEMEVLGEYDQDGDSFMVKYFVDEVYEGDGLDDSGYLDDYKVDERYCIIRISG